MKIEEFKKYKRLAESHNTEMIEASSDISRVRQWMEDSGRIDEGLFSGIWQWLKRNFSVTSRRIHSLADDYEKELREELRAEWKKSKDPKDLASKFRAGTYNRLSRDIAERMEIIAEDDETYRTLARVLVNKKDLKVKKEILKELSGMMDPAEFTSTLGAVQKDVDQKFSEAEKEYDKVNKNLMVSDRKKIDEIVKLMRKKLSDEKSEFGTIGVTTDTEQMEFIKLMYMYVNALSSKVTDINFDAKTVYSIAKEYREFVREMAKKLESRGASSESAVQTVKKAIDGHLREIKNVLPFGRVKTIVAKELESHAASKPETSEEPAEEVSSPETEELMDPSDVDDAIENAEEDTSKDKPTPKEVVEEIEREVAKLFEGDNVASIAKSLNKRIENFNALPFEERKSARFTYGYDVTKDRDYKLKVAEEKDVKLMIPVFIDIVGAIFPYYQKTEESVTVAVTTAKRFIFEIYAMGIDLKKEDKEHIVKNIKEKYPDLFK